LASNAGGFIEVLDAGTWSPLQPLGGGAYDQVSSLATLHGLAGEQELFAAGRFLAFVGGTSVDRVARFDGERWRPETVPSSTLLGDLHALDFGAGEELYLTGVFTQYAPTAVQIVKRTGSTWTPLPTLPTTQTLPVHALAVFDDGQGPRLYAAALPGVWRLDGASWTLVIGPTNGIVEDLCAFDDGSGPALFLGGSFFTINDAPFGNVARWNGQTLNTLQGGSPVGTSVLALDTFDDGNGPRLFAGGSFASMGGVSCAALARWDGSVWSPVGGGVQGSFARVNELRAHDDGSGSKLYVAGRFTSVGGQLASQVAAWDGTAWDTLSGGVTAWDASLGAGIPVVDALAAFDAGDGRGRHLYMGGRFKRAGGLQSNFIARWTSCGGDAHTFCYGDGSSNACPCGNSSAVGDRAGCLNSFGSGGALRVHGRARLSADTLVLEGGGMTNSSVLYFDGQGLVSGGAGVAFGDGLKCTGGPFVRLGTKVNVNGASVYPAAGDPSLSARGMIGVPGTRHYQARYRNSAAFCTPDVFNYTNGVSVIWVP
jgi:hypothetical protein